MKKILFAALAALAITSCTQNEEIEAPSQKSEIKFNTAVSKTSRATGITTETFAKFKAYAYNTDDVYASATSINPFIKGIEFSKPKEDNTAWTTTNTIYWPESDYVSFFAYHITTDADVKWGENPVITTAPTLTYTVKQAIASQEDLIVAEQMNKKKAGGAVTLNFKHALTKIGFKIKGEGVGIKYTIDKIIISANNAGTYTFAADASETNTQLGSWVTTGAATDYTIEPTNDIDLAITADNTTDETLLVDAYTAMLIPQAIKDVTIKVYYKAELEGAILCNKMTTPETISFTEDTTTKWAPGQYMLYTLKLKGGDPISVKGSYTDDWAETPKEL